MNSICKCSTGCPGLMTQSRSEGKSLGYDVPDGQVGTGVVLGLGNPLLDVMVNAEAPLLRKFGLKANDAILAAPKHRELFEMIKKDPFTPMFLAGGACQNTIRVTQWLLRKPRATTFFGCVGMDADGDKLKDVAERGGVRVMYQRCASEPTGNCAALISGQDRSLITALGAAVKFTEDFIIKEENWRIVEMAEVIYVEGFFFDVCIKAIQRVCELAASSNKLLVTNLSAPFLIKYFADKRLNILQYVDVLFGNQEEAAELAKALKMGTTNPKTIATKIINMPKKNDKRKRSVVFTGGRKPTVVGWEGGLPFEEPVDAVPPEKIRDTNACGDAFVGGFLAQLVRKKDIRTCLKCANYAASVIIQHDGCSFPETPAFRLK